MQEALQHSVFTSATVRHLIGIAFLSAFVEASPVNAAAAEQIAFGEPSFTSEKNTGFGLSDDKHTFTLTFDGLEIGLNPPGPVLTSVATRTYSMVIPLSNGDKGVEIPFHFQGFSFCQEGVNAYAVFSVNGQTSTVNFAPGHNDSFVHSMVFKAPYASDVRMTILIAMERDAKHKDAQGYINITSADSATNPAPAEPRIPDTVKTLTKKP